MLIQKHKIIVYANTLLALIIVIVLAKAFLRTPGPQSADARPVSQINQTAPNSPAHSAPSDPAQYDGIIRRDLFQMNPSNTPTNFSGTAPNSVNLDLTLKGTIAGPPSIARALIQNPQTKNSIEPYKIGDLIGQAKLIQIDPDSATFLYHGKKYKITITKTASSQTATASNEKTEPTSHSGRLSQFFEDFISAIDMEPYTVDGQPQGLKITQLKENRSAAFLGLEQGDIIQRVNGQTVTSRQKAFQVFQKAKTQPTLQIELLRDRQNVTRTFQLQ